MFDNLFLLLGHTGTAVSLVTVLGVVSTVVLAELLGTTFRGGGRPRGPRLT